MYQVLYRKYRPQTFSDVVGQEHITETLEGAVISGRLAHAYLFTGTRGCGKTSCAKILAKAVNCEHPVNGNPCNECASCKGIDDGSIMDVIEIDAASNNGVDNIRDLREEANYTPTSVKYRVYIIDEVHMLSSGAFNALLKTLEEPPEHVKFILATTEVHKLPSTILSRCQRFDFKRISPESIANRLKYVSEKENIKLTDAAAMLISRIADGAMRDALSLLDRCASYGVEITEQVASDAAGIAGREHIFSLVDAISSNDSAKALSIINDLYNNSCDMERLITELVSYYRNMMVALTVPNYNELIVCPESELEIIKNQASKLSLATVLSSLDRLNDAIADLKSGGNRRTIAEMTVIRLTSPQLDRDIDSVLSRVSDLELKLKNGVITTAKQKTETVSQPKAAVREKTPVVEKIEEKAVEPAKSDNTVVNDITDNIPPANDDNCPPPQNNEVKANPIIPEPKTMNEAQKSDESNSGDVLFSGWADVVEKLSKTSKPLIGFLTGSSAYIHDDKFLLIKSNNTLLGQMLMTGDYSNNIVNAALEITGKKYRLGLYNTGAPKQQKKDPLDGLLDKAKDLGINFVEQ